MYQVTETSRPVTKHVLVHQEMSLLFGTTAVETLQSTCPQIDLPVTPTQLVLAICFACVCVFIFEFRS